MFISGVGEGKGLDADGGGTGFGVGEADGEGFGIFMPGMSCALVSKLTTVTIRNKKIVHFRFRLIKFISTTFFHPSAIATFAECPSLRLGLLIRMSGRGLNEHRALSG